MAQLCDSIDEVKNPYASLEETGKSNDSAAAPMDVDVGGGVDVGEVSESNADADGDPKMDSGMCSNALKHTRKYVILISATNK